jgi:hypothetical protein
MDIEIVSEEIIDEAKEVSEVGTKGKPYGPKKLGDIVSGKGNDEWSGNTPREASIIKQVRDNTVVFPDVAGNGPDVFAGAKQQRAKFPVKPGEDAENYRKWFNQGPTVAAWYNARPMVKEDVDGFETKTRAIFPHDLDKSWATSHVAPQGSTICSKGDTTILCHPNGDRHHIDGGEKPAVSAKGDKGKFNIVVHSSDYNEGGKFISNKKSLRFGYVNTTANETEAKDFHSKAHAENHINHNTHGLGKYDWMSIHDKRPKETIKADALAKNKAIDAHNTAWGAAVKAGRHPEADVKVRVARQKIRKHTHPGLNS